MADTLRRLELSLLPGRYAISRLPADAALPAWALRGAFHSVTRTEEELSVVTEESLVPTGIQTQPGWGALKVHGPYVLSEIGVLASLAKPLADARISLFVLSTFDTDYLFMASENLVAAISVLERAGHTVHGRTSER